MATWITLTPTTHDMKHSTTCLPAVLGCLLLCLAAPALAEKDIPWNSLSPGEQQVLKKYHHNWRDLRGGEQRKLKQGARNYLQLSPGKQEAVKRKRYQYRKMSPTERQHLRNRYKQQKRKH